MRKSLDLTGHKDGSAGFVKIPRLPFPQGTTCFVTTCLPPHLVVGCQAGLLLKSTGSRKDQLERDDQMTGGDPGTTFSCWAYGHPQFLFSLPTLILHPTQGSLSPACVPCTLLEAGWAAWGGLGDSPPWPFLGP